MKRNREFEQRQARRLARAAALSRLVAPRVRRAASDRKVRLAAGDAYEAGMKMYDEVRGSDPKNVAGRMARDERFQSDLAAFVRSATNAVDAGIASGRRRARRSLARFLMIGTGAACFMGVALRRRQAHLLSNGDGREVRASEATGTAQTEWITG
jgi:hypothetical protein